MEEPISVKINIVSNLHKRKIEAFVSQSLKEENYNFTSINARVIGYLMMNSQHDVFQKNIEEALDLQRSTVSALLKGMESKGFITRESVSYDARVKKILPTRTAIEIHHKIELVLKKFEQQFVQGINEDEMQVFLNVLSKMQHNID